ncbi:MAG: DUF3782 domain-containing protein [Deltaproteobacteria bacterium]|nr:DUF3782 domain-containing protein [Deltaproteobacteria bacterium]
MPLAEVLEEFPVELRIPLVRLVDELKAEFVVRRADFDDLKAIVRDLAKAQQELAEAQKRTEHRVEELVEAQKRTGQQVGELVEAQKRTGQQVGELAEAQKRTESELTLFRRTFTAQIGGLGARWGMQTEEAFRQGMRAVLEEVGFTTERFLDYDKDGEVFGVPDQVEVDVVIQNGKVFVLEIKSSLSRADVWSFNRKVAYYAWKSGRAVTRKLIVTPYLDPRAQEIAQRLGVEICTDVNTLSSAG